VVAGNQFVNNGLVTVAGDNRIDMGRANAVAFDNRGTIDFQDGAADDTLTIAGDLGGDGELYVDVSGLHGTADVLYVGGNVVNGSVHTVNVNMIDVPTTASSAITVASVAGNSTAGSFVLGNAHYDPSSFLALDFDTRLVGTITTGNATADVFELAMDVTGLNDTGTLAASIAPGAQSLMASQVGTWRQRMGVIDKISKGGIGLWARLFGNDGSIDPSHTADNFGQGGNFAFDQRNEGTEIGIDFAVSDQVSAGLLLTKADASQHLNGTGVGSNKLDGDTVGAYATWISPAGFYLDASYRQMDFDARIRSAAGEIRGDGSADAFNLETGYAWTLQGGLKVEPQFQYTWTQVDRIDALSGALADFTAEGGDASTARLGVMVRQSFGTGTVWTPYASINAVRELDGDNAYAINGNFFGATSTEGTSALIEGGVNVQTGKLSIYGGLNWQDGGALQSFGGGQLGVRYNW
jgi:outer membrane autotransporter protein